MTLADGDLATGGVAVDSQLVLVCGHGTRDSCCALRGSAVFGALGGHVPSDDLWLSSHQGGHRFAANVLVLPRGIQLGRLSADNAVEVVSAALDGRIALAHYRGRTAYPAREQAAEHAIREARQLVRTGDLELVEDDGTSVRFVDADRRRACRRSRGHCRPERRRRAAAPSPSRRSTSPRASSEPLRLELVRVVGDPDERLVELLGRLAARRTTRVPKTTRTQLPATSAPARGDLAFPGRAGLEDARELRRVAPSPRELPAACRSGSAPRAPRGRRSRTAAARTSRRASRPERAPSRPRSRSRCRRERSSPSRSRRAGRR